jgi:SAM-dependent methyltransferase
LKEHSIVGSILDIGCGNKPYRYLFADTTQYIGIDFIKYSKYGRDQSLGPDFFFGDSYATTGILPFSDCDFNNIVCFQVLEHHPDPSMLVREAIRVCTSGGLIIFTCPFLSSIHDAPRDYQRFTRFGLSILFKHHDLSQVHIYENGGVASSLTLLLNETWSYYYYIGSWQSRTTLLLFYPFLLLVSYLGLICDVYLPSSNTCPNYTIVARKT